jgi:hypothetical protein
MQPPQILMTMRHYIQNLRTVSEQRLAERRFDKRGNGTAQEPLEAQIQRWWSNLPPSMQQRRFQIFEIAAQCNGKYQDRPALRQVARVLRSIGWREIRDWSTLGRNHRFWTPPEYFGQ